MRNYIYKGANLKHQAGRLVDDVMIGEIVEEDETKVRFLVNNAKKFNGKILTFYKRESLYGKG